MINIFNNRSKKELKLIKEILAIVKTLKPDDQLEKQMDSWLATLKTSVEKVEQVSQQVDSTKSHI